MQFIHHPDRAVVRLAGALSVDAVAEHVDTVDMLCRVYFHSLLEIRIGSRGEARVSRIAPCARGVAETAQMGPDVLQGLALSICDRLHARLTLSRRCAMVRLRYPSFVGYLI